MAVSDIARLAPFVNPASRRDMNRLARTCQRGPILLLLAAALVFVQVLGMMHAVLHDHARTGATSHAAKALFAQRADESFMAALFSGHDSQADCDEFDHITHADHTGFEDLHSCNDLRRGRVGWPSDRRRRGV